MEATIKRMYVTTETAEKAIEALNAIAQSGLWAANVAKTIIANAEKGFYRMSAKQSDILEKAAFELGFEDVYFPIDNTVSDRVEERQKMAARINMERF